MATVGPRYPTTNAVVNTGWSTPAYAYNADGTQLATGAPARNTAFYSDYGAFGFDALVPAGSTIGNVTVEVYGKCSTAAITTATLRWRPAISGTVYGTERQQASVPISLTLYSQVFTGLTRDQLIDAAFKVRLGCYRTTTTAYTFSVDYVRVTVDYTIPPVTGGAVLSQDTAQSDGGLQQALGEAALSQTTARTSGGVQTALGGTVLGQATGMTADGQVGVVEIFGGAVLGQDTGRTAGGYQIVAGAVNLSDADGFSVSGFQTAYGGTVLDQGVSRDADGAAPDNATPDGKGKHGGLSGICGLSGLSGLS